MPHKKRGAKKTKSRKPPERRAKIEQKEILGAEAVTASRNLDLMGDKPPYPVEG